VPGLTTSPVDGFRITVRLRPSAGTPTTWLPEEAMAIPAMKHAPRHRAKTDTAGMIRRAVIGETLGQHGRSTRSYPRSEDLPHNAGRVPCPVATTQTSKSGRIRVERGPERLKGAAPLLIGAHWAVLVADGASYSRHRSMAYPGAIGRVPEYQCLGPHLRRLANRMAAHDKY
jgi:hypothetical protein